MKPGNGGFIPMGNELRDWHVKTDHAGKRNASINRRNFHINNSWLSVERNK